MAPLKHPLSLLCSCIDSTCHLILGHMTPLSCEASTYSEKVNVKNIFQDVENIFQDVVPPVILEQLLKCSVKLIATKYKPDHSMITSLLNLLCHHRLKELCLSDLLFVGTVSTEDLDDFECSLSLLLPRMTQLTYIDLSTHLTKVTWPSCSSRITEILGQNCPNLQVLDMNNNNRITGESLYDLCPNMKYEGCPLLEKLFIQDCSVDPHYVVGLLWNLPNLTLIGYKELGSSLAIYKKKEKKRKCKSTEWTKLKLTHVDNTLSKMCRTDSALLKFLYIICPLIVNLKARVSDQDCKELQHFRKLRHLELRCYTERGMHHRPGPEMMSYICSNGHYLYSLTIYSTLLLAEHVAVIAQHCYLVEKLYLHSNTAEEIFRLQNATNNLTKLEILSLRIGSDELKMCSDAGSLVNFLVSSSFKLQELYLLMRCSELNQDFFASLIDINPLLHLSMLICDAPRRTLSAPMLPLTIETLYYLIQHLPSLKIIGNIICWNVNQLQVDGLMKYIKSSNYDVKIINSLSNKINTKYF